MFFILAIKRFFAGVVFVLVMTFLRLLCRNCWSIWACYVVPGWLRFFLLFFHCYLFFYCQISNNTFFAMFFCPKCRSRFVSVGRVLCCCCFAAAFACTVYVWMYNASSMYYWSGWLRPCAFFFFCLCSTFCGQVALARPRPRPQPQQAFDGSDACSLGLRNLNHYRLRYVF